MPIVNPFEDTKQRQQSGIVNPFEADKLSVTPNGFDFLEEEEEEKKGIFGTLKKIGGGIIDTAKTVGEQFKEVGKAIKNDPLFTKEVLGPSALIKASKKVGKEAVTYPVETLEAGVRGFYSGGIEPIIEAGVRLAIPKAPPIQEKIVEALRKPGELGEKSVITGRKFPETAEILHNVADVGGIIAPFALTENLVAKILPRLPRLATSAITWVGLGQILHRKEDGTRAQQAVWDLALLGVFEALGLGIRGAMKALKPKTSGTITNLAAGEKVTLKEAEEAAAEIKGRFKLEYDDALQRERAVKERPPKPGEPIEAPKARVIAGEAEAKIIDRGIPEKSLVRMLDDFTTGRSLVAEEEKKVARSFIEEFNKQFPSRSFPLEDISGAARRLEGVERIGEAKIERLQILKETLAAPFIKSDLQDLRAVISDLRKEISDVVPKEIKTKSGELPFIATDEQIEASLSNARTLARDELKETILTLETKLARLESGTLEPSLQQVERAIGRVPQKDLLRIVQEARRKLSPELLVKDKIVKIDKEILATTNEIAQRNRLLQGILDSGKIAEKRVAEKFPQMYNYQNYLREQINLATPPPTIKRGVAEWRPNTIGYRNPYTKQAYKLWNKVVEFWDRKLPRILKVAKSREVGAIAQERQRVMDALVSKHKEDIVKLVEKMPFQERTKVGLMINKYIPIEEGYAPLIRDIDLAIGKLGNAIVDLNKQWVKEGLIPANAAFLTEETWFKNLGQYSRSFYTDVVAPTGEKLIVEPGKVKAFVNRSQFKKKLTLKEWGERTLEFEGKTKAEILQMSAKEVEQTGLRAKQEYGWVYEADAVLEKTFKDSINNYTTMQWQDAIVKDPMLFSKVEVPGFIPVKSFLRPGIERDIRLGPLQDGWVHPGLSEELAFFASAPRDAASIIFGEVLSWWKTEKTAMGPAVFRNFVSGGGIQTDMAGFAPWYPKNAKTYIDSTFGKNGYVREGERYKFWRDKGLFGSDFFAVEISPEMERIIRKSSNPYAETGNQLEKLMKLSRKGKENFRYYGAIDHMHRQYLAEAAFKNGATAEQAVHFANKWQLDYRIVPQFLDKTRKGIGGYIFPFMSFYTLMLPRIAETLVTRPWVLMKYPIIAKSLEYVAMKKLGLTPEQVENGKPEFLKDQPYTVLLPWTDDQDNQQYFDMSYTMPFGSWETGFIDWAQYGQMGKTEGVFGIVRGLLENRDPFTGDPIWTEADAKLGKKDGKIATYILRGAGPGAAPHIMNIYGAATGEVIGFPFQRPKSLTQASLRAVGLSTYSGGFNEASWKIKDLEHDIDQINFSLGKTLQDPTVGEQEKNDITDLAIESINELSLQISEIARNMPPAPGELTREQIKKGSTEPQQKIINPFAK